MFTQVESFHDGDHFQIGAHFENKVALHHHVKMCHFENLCECYIARFNQTVMAFKCSNKNSDIRP